MVTMVILRWLLVASFLWEVSSVCVWQGGGGFRLACGFRQSGLFRIRSIGGLKGWAGAGFTIGDEDGFKDSLTNQEATKGSQPQVQPAQQQYLGQYSNQKVRVVKAPSHYSSNSIPNNLVSTNITPQQLHLVPGNQFLPSVPSLSVVPPSVETPGLSRAGLQKRSSLWDRMKQLSPINLLPGRKKRPKNSNLSPSANPNNFNNYRAQDGSRIVPMPFPGGIPQPQPPQFESPIIPVRKKKKSHYAGRVAKTSEVTDDELYDTNNSGVPVFKPIPHLTNPDEYSVEKRILTEEDYTLEEEPTTKRPKKKKKGKGKAKKEKEEKPYGLKLLENSENYGKKFHIEPSPRPEKNEEEIIVEEDEQQAEPTVSEKVEGYKYDNNIFPDIYFTTTSTSSTEGLKRMLDVESTTKTGKLKKIKLIRNRKKKNGTSMNIPILSMSTPMDDFEETSPTTTTTFQTSSTPRLILSTKRPKGISPTKTSFKANVDFGENLFQKDERGHVSPSDFLEELKKFNEKVIENANAKREEFMRTSTTTSTTTTTTKAPLELKNLPNLYEYYDPRYPPDHEVNRKKIEELVKENDSTRPTTPTPPSFFTRNDYYNPKTHFSRAPVVKPDSSFIKLDSVESQTLINKTKTYNDKFYSHFNRTGAEVSPTEPVNYFDFYAQQSANTTTTTERPELPEIELPWEKRPLPTMGAAINTGRPAEVNQHGNTWNVPEPPELPTNELMKKQLEFDDGPRGSRYWNNYRNSPDVDFVTNDNFKNSRMDIDVVKSPEVLEVDFDSSEGAEREQRVVEEVAESVKSILFAPSDRAAEPGSFRSNSEVDAWNSGNFYRPERRKKIQANLRPIESEDSENNGFMSGSERAMDKLEDQIKELTKDSMISSEEAPKKPEPVIVRKKLVKVIRKKPEPPKVEEKEEEEEEEEEEDAKDDESEDEETTTKKKVVPTPEVEKKRGKPRFRQRGKQIPSGSMAPPLPPPGQPAQSQFFSDSPQQNFAPPVSSMGGKEPDFGASTYNNFQPFVLPPQNSFQTFSGPGPMRMLPSAMPPRSPNPNMIRRQKVPQKKGGFFRNIFGGKGGKGAKVKAKHRFPQGPASGPHPSFVGPSMDPLLLPPAPPPGNNFMSPSMANFYQFQQQANSAYGQQNNFFQQQALAHHMQNLKMNQFNNNNNNNNNNGLRHQSNPNSRPTEISITKLTVKPKWNKMRGRDQERIIEEEFFDEDEEESEKILVAKPKPKPKRPIQRPRPTESDFEIPKKRIDPEKASILHALKVLTKARTDSIESVVSEHYGLNSKNGIRDRIKTTTTTTPKPPTLADLTAKLTPLLNLAQESLGRPFQRFHSNNNNNQNNNNNNNNNNHNRHNDNNRYHDDREDRERERRPQGPQNRRPQNPPSRIHKDNLDLESNPNLIISVPDFNDKARQDRTRHREYHEAPSFSTDDIASLLSKPDSRETPPPPPQRRPFYDRRQEERKQDSQVLSDDFLRSQMSLFLDKEISRALQGPNDKPSVIVAKPNIPLEMQHPFLDKTDFAKRVGYLAGNINNALSTPETKHHHHHHPLRNNMNNITNGQLDALKKLLILDKLEQNIDRFESSNPHRGQPQRPLYLAMPKTTQSEPLPTAPSHPDTTFFPMPMKTPPPTFASEWIPKTTLATLLQSFVNHSVAPNMPSRFPAFQSSPSMGSMNASPTSPSLLSNTMLTPNARAILALKAFALKRAQTSKPDPRIGLANPTQSNAITSINPTLSTYTPHGIDLTSILNPNPSPFPSESSWTSRSVMLDVKNAPKSFYPANASVTFDTEKNLVSDFACEEQKFFPGLYADTNLSCKVFHLCAKTEKGYIKKTFRCPKETVFDQEVLKCNWNLYVECKDSKEKYHFNKYLSQSFQFLRILGEFSASYQKTNGTTTG